jgi:hypothetical protein
MADSKGTSNIEIDTHKPAGIENVHENVVTKRRWVNYLWDTFDKSREERRFLFKLDTALLTFASLGELNVVFSLYN